MNSKSNTFEEDRIKFLNSHTNLSGAEDEEIVNQIAIDKKYLVEINTSEEDKTFVVY